MGKLTTRTRRFQRETEKGAPPRLVQGGYPVSETATESETLAERVRRATFRETVATINHQINNPLSEILATVEMLRLDDDRFESEAKLNERLQAIEQSARRIQRVTLRLADLADPSPHQTPAGGMIRLPEESLSSADANNPETSD